ncbi:hypothetical protein Tco_0915589 [Tanacetum coccineum]
MEELLQARHQEGYGEAIVLPEINADHFEIKTNLLQLVQANPFHGFERENPHTHIKQISNRNYVDIEIIMMSPNDVIKLMMFPYSLEGAARVWLSIHLVVYNEELAIPEQTATEGKLKENQGCRVDTDQVHQNGDLKNRSVWIHPPGLQDVYTKET